jgi:hypothetical protein
MFKIILSIIFVFCYHLSNAQDLIYKKDNKIIAGKIISIDSSTVIFQEIGSIKNQNINLALSEIKEIKFDYGITSIRNKNQFDYTRAKNAVSFGFGGTGGILSINYDRVIFQTQDFFLSAKAGIGSWVSQTNINAHITGNYNFGGSKHYFEFGLGAAAALGQFDKYHRYYASLPILGYRLQPKSEKFFFRIYGCTFVLIQDSANNSFAVPTLAMDLGFSF